MGITATTPMHRSSPQRGDPKNLSFCLDSVIYRFISVIFLGIDSGINLSYLSYLSLLAEALAENLHQFHQPTSVSTGISQIRLAVDRAGTGGVLRQCLDSGGAADDIWRSRWQSSRHWLHQRRLHQIRLRPHTDRISAS